MSILFAATYPERVTALILASASARWFPAPGYPCGQGRRRCTTPSGTSPRTGGARARPSSGTCPARPTGPGPAAARAVRADGGEPQRVPPADADDPRHRRPGGTARDPHAHAGDPAPQRPHHAALPRSLPGLPHRRRALFRAARRPFAAVRGQRRQRRAVRGDHRISRQSSAADRNPTRVLATILRASAAGPPGHPGPQGTSSAVTGAPDRDRWGRHPGYL